MAAGQKTLKITADLDRIIAKTGVTQRQALTEFVGELGLQIVRETPVDTGRLRASWFPSPTLAATAQPVNASEINPGAGGIVIARLDAEVAATIGDGEGQFYFLNGANYAIYVEARRQFVRKVVGRSRAIADQVIRNIAAIRGSR